MAEAGEKGNGGEGESAFLLQVITCAEFHPQQCHTFAYSSSKGGIKVGDMRAQALCDNHAKVFEVHEDPVSGGVTDPLTCASLHFIPMFAFERLDGVLHL